MDINTILYITFAVILFLIIVTVLTSRSRIVRIYGKYMKISNKAGITGEQFAFGARDVLKYNDMQLSLIDGKLTDAYLGGKHRVLFLSEEVAHTASLASLTIVAHELGHAMQDYTNYTLYRFTRTLNKITRITNKLVIPLLLIGFALLAFQSIFINWFEYDLSLSYGLIAGGTGLFILGALFRILTIPMERDASRRGLAFLKDNSMLSGNEIPRARKLLAVASQTYMVALFDGLLITKLLKGNRKRKR